MAQQCETVGEQLAGFLEAPGHAGGSGLAAVKGGGGGGGTAFNLGFPGPVSPPREL